MVIQQVHLEGVQVDIKYYYTDIWIITAVSYGLIGTAQQKKSALAFLRSLSGFDYHEKQRIPLTLFFEPKSVEHLLGIMGFNNRYDFSMHRYFICNRHSGELAPVDFIDERIRQEFSKYGAMHS